MSPPEWLRPLAAAVAAARPEDFPRAVPAGVVARESAVLLLFAEGHHGPDLLLIERADSLRDHAGQPALPGGSVDAGDSGPVAAALREAGEEVGVDPATVRVIGTLPALYIEVSRFAVTPVVAWWERPASVRPVEVAEVASVDRVPLAAFADPANRCRVRHPSGRVGPAFCVHGMLVWGFTAALIDRVLDLGGWARPWDPGEPRPFPR